MKKIVVILLATALSLGMSAQPKDVVLVVTGDGTSKELATNNALRSAVEQAFGVFVSANTEILNDELVRDEIATITSGNIKSFKELSAEKAPSGDWFVSLQAEVSIGNLVSYAKSHGSSAEFAGNTFAANLRMRELNKQNEAVALENLVSYVKKMSPQMFDFILTPIEDPKYCKEFDAYVFSIGVEVRANEASDNVYRTILNVLESLQLTTNERMNYLTVNESYSTCAILYNDYKSDAIRLISTSFFLRNDPTYFSSELREAIIEALFGFFVYTKDPLQIHQFEMDDCKGLESNYLANYLVSPWKNYRFKHKDKYMDNRFFGVIFHNLDNYKRAKGHIYLPGWPSVKSRFSITQLTTLNQSSIYFVVPILLKREDLPKLTGFEVKRKELNLNN